MKKTSYMASYDTESIRCLDGLRCILGHHRELNIPATIFITGELLEDESWAAEFRRLTDHPLFEIGNHTYTHLSLVTGPERSDWDLEILTEEVERTNRQIERVTDKKPIGFRTPCGFSRGLRGEREIRYVSSRLMGENGTLPAPPDRTLLVRQ